MKKAERWILENWRVTLVVFFSSLFLLFLYGFQLNGLTKGLSPIEVGYTTSNDSVREVLSQPVFLPHKILILSATKISQTFRLVRLPSMLWTVLCIASFYLLIARWHTYRIALLSLLLFATSSWTLTIGRQALPTASYLAWLPMLAAIYWTTSKGKQLLTLGTWGAIVSLAFYVPGLLWFAAVMAASQRKRIQSTIIVTPPLQLALVAVGCSLLLLPFLFSIVMSPMTALAALGIPTTTGQITGFPYRLIQIFAQVFVYSSNNPVFHLGHLPYLDITTGILFALGLYRLRYSAARKLMAWTGLVAGGWLVGAGLGAVNIAIFLPLIYIFVGGGLSFLLVQWFKVFPKNPIARSTGVALITVLVLFISFYHLNRYFIAWPRSPQTKQAFSDLQVLK